MKHIFSRIICTLFATFFLNTPAYSQDGLWFRSDHDISSSLIKQLLTDSKGMVWVSTDDGLNRFDGSKFNIYRNHKNDSLSVASNIIDHVFEDSSGNLFVISFNGIQLYDYGTDKFSPIGKRADGKPIEGDMASMIELPDGQLWTLGRTPMRIEVTPEKNILLHNLNFPDEIKLISNAIADKDGGIWMTKGAKGTFYRDKTGRFKKYNGKSGDPVFVALTLDNAGNLYAGCIHSGLYRFDKKNDRFINISPEIKGISIKYLDTSPEGTIIVGTDKDGLYEYDPSSGTTRLVPIPYIDSNKAKVHSVAYDRYGNRWLGIFQKGLLMLPPSSLGFKRLNADHPFSSFNNTCVSAILEDSDGMLWIGTDNDGIYKFDSKHNPISHLTTNVPPIVTGMLEDSNGQLWVTSYGNGIGKINKSTGHFSPLRLIDKVGNEVKHSFGMVKDRDGNLWISTMGSGLFKMDGQTGAVTPCQLTKMENLWIPSIHYSKKDNLLFLGSYAGLDIIDLSSGKAKTILPARIVYDMEDGSDGNHWVGTSEGLAQLNAAGDLVRIFTTDDGLPSSTIYSVAEADGILWVGSSMGISKINPATGAIQNYTVDDGLQGNEFSRNAVAMGADSTLYFGGINGLTFFNPKDINTTGHKRDVRISDFYLNGFPVRIGSLSGGEPIIESPVFEANDFSLSHHDNSFAIEFTTSDPNGTSQVEYWYAFDNDEWRKTEAGSPRPKIGKALLNFSDIPVGKHELRIKVVDNGVESEIRTLNIEVRPAWYQTAWAKILYVFLVIAVLAAIAMVYAKEQRRKQRELELAHEEELNESRIQFLVNISHDIRTPMSLIIDPLRRLIASDDDSLRKKAYTLMLRNANRIMHLVNEVMDFRKIEKGKMQLSIREVKATGFLNDLVELFRPAATAKDISLSFSHEGCDDLSMWVDYENFDKVMMNLLSNAIKYTPKGGKIHVTLSAAHGKIRIDVADTGEGIPESEREKIFDRFYQAPNHMTGGTGVGLHITRALVQLHGGDISVADNTEAGKGTVFTVLLPADSPKGLMIDNLSADTRNQGVRDIEIPLPDSSKTDDRKLKSRKTVFIVEDDIEIRQYLSIELGKTYNVGEYSNGREALDAILKEQPDLVVSDVMMPEMDGIELTKAIKQNVRLNTLPVILLTAKTRNEDNIVGLDAGADAYMSKPFNIDVLIARVATLIDTYSRLKKAFDGSQTQEKHVQKVETVSNDEKLMERTMKIINENLSDPELTVEMIADKVGLSRVHLYRKLKEITNQSPKEFIRNYRLNRAAELLLERKINVSQISDHVGFSTPNNFSTAFKKLFGMTPSEYIARHSAEKNQSGESASDENHSADTPS